MTVARERSRLVRLKAIPTGNPTPLANAAIEIPPVITLDVIRPQFHEEKMPQSQTIFLIDMSLVLVGC